MSEKDESGESIWDNYKAPIKINPITEIPEEIKEYWEEKQSNHLRGLYQQIQQENIHTYNPLTAKDLREALSGLFNK